MEKVAILGVGMSDFGKFWDKEAYELVLDAVIEAMDDAGSVTYDDIEASFFGTAAGGIGAGELSPATHLNYQLGLTPRPAMSSEGACSSGAIAFRQAAMSVASGMYNVVLVVGFEKSSVDVMRFVYDFARMGDVRDEVFVGTPPAMVAASHYREYLKRYDYAKEEDLALVAVRGFEYAMDNPHAFRKRKITVEDVMNSPYLLRPLKQLEMHAIVDGAAAAILCREEIAKKYTDNPVYLVNSVMTVGPPITQNIRDLAFLDWMAEAAREAFSLPGLGVHDMDVGEIPDAFTCLEVIHSESIGLFKPGEGVIALREGRTRREGDIPINVSGGAIGRGSPVGALGLAQAYEIVRQLKGKAGASQIKGAEKGFTVTAGDGNYCIINVFSR